MKPTISALFLATFFSACGAKAREPSYPTPPYPRIEAQIARIKPLLLRCEDGMPGKNTCSLSDHGDTLGQASYYMLGNQDEFIPHGFIASVGADGRPFRSPRHREANDGDFSRDHVLSHALFAASTGITAPLTAVLSYAQHNSWQVCGDRGKCLLTPGVLQICGDAIGMHTGSRPYGTDIPGYIGEQQAKIEVETLSGQALSLVVDKVIIKILSNNLNTNWQGIARQAANKEPSNLYFAMVNTLANGGDWNVVAESVAVELEAWEAPSPSGAFDRTGSGWQLVGLGGWLLRVR